MNTTIKMQSRGVLTLPKKMREKLNLETGSLIQVKEQEGGLLVTPVSRLDSNLLHDVHAALLDIRAGRLTPAFASGKELETYIQKKKKHRT